MCVGVREHDQVLGWKRQERNPVGQENEWKYATLGGGKSEDPLNIPETWDVRDSQDSKLGGLR